MAVQNEAGQEPRTPLSRDRVLTAAVKLADEQGIDAVTMRNLARHLGVEAMSLYYHVANKEELLDGMVELVVAETNAAVDLSIPANGWRWKETLRERFLTARQVMLRHPWGPAVIETRAAMSPAIIFYFESVLGTMREGGFSYDLAHHAMHALGSRALGFTQELFQPDDVDEGDDASEETMAEMADQLPYLTGMLAEITHDADTTLGWCDDQTEFEFGLDLLLDGLERLAESS